MRVSLDFCRSSCPCLAVTLWAKGLKQIVLFPMYLPSVCGVLLNILVQDCYGESIHVFILSLLFFHGDMYTVHFDTLCLLFWG
jgi:hypothetical protein